MQDDELKFVRKISQLKEFIKILFDEAEIQNKRLSGKRKERSWKKIVHLKTTYQMI